MERGASARMHGKPPGILETFADAFSALLVNPLPILLPILVDAYLALGPRVSPAALTTPLAGWIDAQARQAGPDLASLGVAPADYAAQIAGVGQHADLVAAVGWIVPSLLAGVDRVGLAGAGGRATLTPGGAGVVIALWAAFIVIGIALVMLYRVLLARASRGDPLLDATLPADALRATGRYLAFLALLVGASLAFGVPAGALLGLTSLVSADLASLVGLLLVSAVIIVSIMIAFVAEAIALADAGPIDAIRISRGVVRHNTWPALGLIFLSWLALFVLPDILGRFTQTGLGLALAVAVYAFVATGIALARMQFLRDRLPQSRVPAAVASAQAGRG
ncbi:MAG TPA: hypothetical protein VFX03_04715 [Thermomicrobiales bacterium]|nr:hypothetical protein [Thermomicrobiales bacterium]